VGADVTGALHGPLLLPLLTLLVLLFFVRGWLSIIVSHKDLLSEFYPELTLFDPRGFWFELNATFFQLKLFEDNSLVNTRDHVWWLYEREGKAWLEHQLETTISKLG
jgi:hypothetical protein